jgi:hypothetical protein
MKKSVLIIFLFISLLLIIVSVAVGQEVPDAVDDSSTTFEDVPIPLTIYVLNNDIGDSLTISAITQPANGYVLNLGQWVTYEPNPDYCGEDSFNYTISDDTGTTNTAGVSISITCVNDSPIAKDYFMGVIDHQMPTEIHLEQDTDIDGDLLEVMVTTSPEHGMATGNNNIIAYMPDLNYCGNDNFAYEVSDGHGGTDSGIIDVTIYCSPIPPEISCGSHPPLSLVGAVIQDAIYDYSNSLFFSKHTWCNNFESVNWDGTEWDNDDWILDVPNVTDDTVSTSADDYYSMIGDMIRETNYVFSLSSLALAGKVPQEIDEDEPYIVRKYFAPAILDLHYVSSFG